jgi:hypothetical protein
VRTRILSFDCVFVICACLNVIWYYVGWGCVLVACVCLSAGYMVFGLEAGTGCDMSTKQ